MKSLTSSDISTLGARSDQLNDLLVLDIETDRKL